jgi:hypothetical protein
MVQIAFSPIEWHVFQALMSDFGYEMVAHVPGEDAVIFGLKPGAPTEGYRNPVTVSYPDCVSKDGVTPAYERDFVIDMITQALGADGDKVIATILAKRHFSA